MRNSVEENRSHLNLNLHYHDKRNIHIKKLMRGRKIDDIIMHDLGKEGRQSVIKNYKKAQQRNCDMGKVDVILMFQQSVSKLSSSSETSKKKFRPLK